MTGNPYPGSSSFNVFFHILSRSQKLEPPPPPTRPPRSGFPVSWRSTRSVLSLSFTFVPRSVHICRSWCKILNFGRISEVSWIGNSTFHCENTKTESRILHRTESFWWVGFGVWREKISLVEVWSARCTSPHPATAGMVQNQKSSSLRSNDRSNWQELWRVTNYPALFSQPSDAW